jgi:hypothetical protein
LEGLEAEYGIVVLYGANPIVFASCLYEDWERISHNLMELS